MVKGPTGKFCRCGEELQHNEIHDGWSVWKIPVAEYWEVPLRHDIDREKRRAMYPNVDKAYWGEEYWEKRKRLRQILIQDAEKESFEHYEAYEHFTNGYRAYGAVKTISLMSQRDWNWQEPEPPLAAVQMPNEGIRQAADEHHIEEENDRRANENRMDNWDWRGHVPPPAVAQIPDGGMQRMANENHMEEESKRSTSTEGQWQDRTPHRGVRYLENGTMREYVENGQVDHQRYMWRRNQPLEGYPWYWENQ